MKKTLLVVERIVLESLEGRGRSLGELTDQCGLSEPLLKAVLGQLLERGMILYHNHAYELNWKNKELWLPIVKDQHGVKAEIKELFSSLVNKSFERFENQRNLRMKKVWLEPKEQEVFDSKIREIDVFLEGVQQKRKTRPVRERTCGKRVIFYGSCIYQDLVDDMLCAG